MIQTNSDLQHHLDAATAAGSSIADYARGHSLNPRQLYDYRYHQKRIEPNAIKTAKATKSNAKIEAKTHPTDRSTQASAFSRLAITTPAPSIAKVQLANGVVIELSSESLVLLLPTLVTL